MTAAASSQITDDWVEGAESTLASKVYEAEEHRYVFGLPNMAAGSGEVLSRLADVRTRMDRVEGLLAEVARFRTGTRVLLKAATARVDDKWAERVANTPGGKRATFGEQVEGPRERYARADVYVVGDRMDARRRERVMDAVQDSYDAIERVRRGLDAVRFDLHAMLRLFSSEHRLDRTDG